MYEVMYLLLLLPFLTNAYYITVDADEEQCFHEKLTSGSTMGVTFEVSEGGFLDIDIKITGPDNSVVYSGERESSGRYSFSAHMDGIYTFCFSNKMSSMTPKTLVFSLDARTPHVNNAANAAANENADNQKLEEMIKELSGQLTSVKHEQEYMAVRDRVHRNINDATNARVVQWAGFEALIVFSVSIGQVWYLKRFFEVRRVV